MVENILSKIAPKHLSLALFIFSGWVMIGTTWSLYGSEESLPPPRKMEEEAPEKASLKTLRYKEFFYRSQIESDAKKLKIQPPTLESLHAGAPHFIDYRGSFLLKGTESFDTPHLFLEAGQEKHAMGEEGSSLSAMHLTLNLTNKTDRYLAYRVITKAPGKCARKGAFKQNAIAIAPKQKISRSECLLFGSKGIMIKFVEVLEISEL